MSWPVFKDVRFYVIKCENKCTIDQLKSSGAVQHPLLSESVRFAISDDSSLVEVGEAEDLYAVPVVTTQWIQRSGEAGQFLPFKLFHPDFKPLFSNLVFTLSELSFKDRLSIWACSVIHGAKLRHAFDRTVTHVIIGRAVGPIYTMCKDQLKDDGPVLVTPDWIVDCLAKKQLLPCESYHPDLLKLPTSLFKPTQKPAVIALSTEQSVTSDLVTRVVVDVTTTIGSVQQPPATPLNVTSVLQPQPSPLPPSVPQPSAPVGHTSIASTLPGTNLQAATGITVQQICMKAAEQQQQQQYGALTAHDKAGRGGHARSGPGRGAGAPKRGTHYQQPLQNQQQQQHQQQQQQPKFAPTGPVGQVRYMQASPNAPRFPNAKPAGAGTQLLNQRFPGTLPGVLDQNSSLMGMIAIPGTNVIGVPDTMGLLTQPHTSASMQQTSYTGIVFSGPTAHAVTTTATGGHGHGKGTKSKSSKHAQEQNLNEEEKDAIVFQYVKNILNSQNKCARDTSLGRTFGASESTVTVGTVHPNLGSSGSMSVATINTTGTCQFGSGGNLVTCQSIGPTGFGQVSNLCGPTAPGTPRKPKSPKSPGRAGANAFSGSGNSGGMKGTPKSPKGAKLSAVTKVLSSPPQQQPQQQQYQQQPQSASIVMASCPGASIPSVLLTGSLSQLQARQSNGTTMQPLPSGPTSAVSRPTSVQHFLATGSLPPPPPPHHLHQQQSQPQLSQQPQAMQQHVVSAAPAYLVQRHPGGQLLATVSRQPAQLHTQSSMAIQSQYQRAGGMLTAVSSCVQIPSQSAPLQQQRQFSQTQLSQPALYVRTTRQPYPAEVSDLVTTDHSSVAGAEQSINESLTSVLVTTGPSALPPQSSPYPPHVQLHHHQQPQSVVSFSQPMPQQMLLQQPAGHQLIQLKTSHGSQQTTQQLVDTTPGTNVCLSGMAQVGGVSLVGRMQPQQQLSTMSLGQQLTNHPSASMPQHNTGKPGTHHVQLSTVGRMSPVSSRVVPQTNQACYATQSQPQQQQQQPHSHHQQQKVKLSVPAAQFQGYVQAGQQPTQQIIFQSQTGQQLIAHHQPVAAAVSRGSVTPTGLSPSGVVLRAIGPHSAISTSASSTMCGILPTQSHLVTIASACAPQAPNQTAHMVNGVAGLQNSLLFQANQPTDCATLVQQSHQPMLQSHHHQQQQQRHQLYPHPQSAPQQQTGIPLQGQSGKPVQLPIQPQLVRPNQAASVNVVGLNAGTVSYHTGVCALTPTSGGENISPQQHAAMVRAAGPNQAMVQLRHAQPVVPSQTLTRPVSCNQQPVPTPVAPTPLTAPPAPPILPTYYGHEGAPKPTRPEECLIGCVFLLLGYRAASESQRALWRRVMRSYGAEVVMAYDPNRVTHLVIDCQLEEPAIVKQALRDRIRIVTIFWVNDVLSKGRMIPPYEILHLPSPFSNDITFSFIKSQIISLTGFEGKDRLKVEFMIRQLGASFTDYLEPSNTLLVCKRPEGKKYEMAQSWSVPCVNVRWLQDIYFGDLMALALDIPHKYLSFEPADVTVSLDRCTPRVQDLMIGWQTPIRLNHDAWTRLTKLSNDFAMEERERKRKLELDVISQPKSKKRTKCALAPLCEADVKLAMKCRTRLELLIAEAKEKGELQAALKEKLKRIVITEEQCPAQLPEVSELIKHGVQHKLADEECMLEGNETTHSYTSIQSEASEEPVVKSELALVGGGTLADSLTSQYALPNTPFSTSIDSLLESNQSNRPSALATSSFSAGPISTEPCAMIQVAPVVSPLTQAGGSVGNEVKLSDSPKQTDSQRRNEVMTHDTVQSVVSLDVVHEASKAECEIISIKPEDESLGNNQTAVDRPVGGEVPQLSGELVAVRSNFSAPAVTISNADVPVNPSVVPSRKRTATDDLSDMNTKRPATDPLVDKGGIPETTCTVEIITYSQAPLISISAPSAEGLSAETPGSVVQTDTEAPVVKRSEDCIPPMGYPQSPATINTSVRIAFTAIDYESRLSLVELCLQLPDCQMVDSAEDATHLVCSRLLRTPKTYIAVALGRYLVTPKWIQASVLRGVWLDETPWLLSDPDAETQLGVRLSDSMVRARRRQMLGPEASLFAGLEFWLSPGACHREMCATLIKAGGGVVRHKRPTQKMALLPQPRQLIICHEDDSNVANYLMRLKTGNKAVHHEEFILSGVLRQELDYESYQIQYVNTLQSSLKAAVAAAEAALAHGGAMPQVPRTTVTECSGVNQAEVVCSTTGSRRPSLGTTECVSLDGRPVERDPRPINHSLLSTALPTRTSLESPRTPILRTGSTDSSSDPSHSVSMNSYANLDTYAVLTSEARYSTSGTPLRPFAAQRQSVALTETPGHSMAPPIPKTHICRPTVPTGLQHLLADSMDHSHLPQDYYPISYRAHGPYDLVPSSRYRHPDAVHQSPLNTSTGTFCVTRATDGSSSYAGEIATAVNSSAAVSAYHHSVSPTTRHTYDPGPPGTEITSEPQRSISRPRAGGLLLSGPLTIPGTSYPTHRPVTALTAMIVAAESSTHDVASTEATSGASVSTFVLPNSTAAFRAPCVTSSMMTQSSGLNARSAAADAHAVATATAAAANALIQSDRKSVVSLNDNGTSVPRARSPRTTLSASLFVADMSESKKPRIPVMHSISSGLSNASSLDAVTSLISAPMTFQMPVGTSDLTNLCRSYSPSVYSVGDHLHISTAHPVESVTALSCASTAAASLHSPVGRSLFPKVVSNFVDSDLARSASTELYPRLSVSSPSISSSVCLNSSTQSVTITENTAFLLMDNNLMSTSGDIRPSVCPLPSSITLVSEPNHDHEQRNVHTTIASSSTHSASLSAEYRGALPSSNFESRI